MKRGNILRFAVLCSALSGLSTQAALLGITEPSGSPYLADFTGSGLNVSYVYSGNSSSGTGTLTASSANGSINTPTANNAFTANNDSPGTGSFSEIGFEGYFTLNATIVNNNGAYSVSSGTVDIYGDLGSPINSSSSDLLLSASLKSGSQNFGYTDGTTKTSAELDFLFSVTDSDGLGNTANQKIFEDFFGPIGGQGGIILTTGALSTSPAINIDGYTGLDASFANKASGGEANTFVPEPAAYPLAASVFAILGFAGAAVSRRKQA